HLLGLELGSQPFVERTTIGPGHARIIDFPRIGPYPPFVQARVTCGAAVAPARLGVWCGSRGDGAERGCDPRRYSWTTPPRASGAAAPETVLEGPAKGAGGRREARRALAGTPCGSAVARTPRPRRFGEMA